MYPFGYGLSYTSFSFTNLRVNGNEVKPGQPVELSVDVENTGGRPGDEVAQLYIHQQSGGASRPVRQLKGFQRIALAPHQKQTVRFVLGKDELSYWSSSARKWVQDAAQFDVWMGADSAASAACDLYRQALKVRLSTDTRVSIAQQGTGRNTLSWP